jgi:hypothetical protein
MGRRCGRKSIGPLSEIFLICFHFITCTPPFSNTPFRIANNRHGKAEGSVL